MTAKRLGYRFRKDKNCYNNIYELSIGDQILCQVNSLVLHEKKKAIEVGENPQGHKSNGKLTSSSSAGNSSFKWD